MTSPDDAHGPSLKAALFYASKGWSVVPVHTASKVNGKIVCSCSKGELCTSPGKHPAVSWSRYQKVRASDVEIRAWFSGPFRANGVGLITGQVSGVFVVDVDCGPGKQGADTLNILQLNNDDLPETCEAITGSGGRHYLFKNPPDVRIITDKAVLGPDVDVRGEGGFIVASPSFHACGNRYRWKPENHPQTMEVADAPAWLVEASREDHWHKRQHDGAKSAPGVIVRHPITGKVTDGRETHMCRIIMASLITYCGENGCFPDSDELFDESWPTYFSTTDFSRPGRGAEEFRHKCVTTLRRAEAGSIHEFPDLDSFVASAAAKKNAEAGPTQDEMQSDADNIASGQTDYPLPLIWYDDIEAVADVNDFVEDTLGIGAMSVVYGESNCGKTFWASDLAMHVASGIKWRGKEVEQGAVIYVALEGGHGIKNRVAAYKKHYKIKSMPFAVIPSSINMLDPLADTPKLITTILAVAKQLEGQGWPVRMVVIDTLSRALAGGNENASEDMGAIVINADKVRQATGVHLMFIHHSGKNAAAGARGHSLLRAATDTEIEVTRDEEAEVSTASVTKQREMEKGQKYSFSLLSVDLVVNRRGKMVTSCVVCEEENSGSDPMKLTAKAKEVLSHFNNFAADQDNVKVATPMKGMKPLRVVTSDGFYQYLHDLDFITLPLDGGNRTMLSKAFKSLKDNGIVMKTRAYIWSTLPPNGNVTSNDQ
jgi:hypothetical protein